MIKFKETKAKFLETKAKFKQTQAKLISSQETKVKFNTETKLKTDILTELNYWRNMSKQIEEKQKSQSPK